MVEPTNFIPRFLRSDETESEPSKDIHARVEAARKIQRKRYASSPSLACNARLTAQTLQRFCPMDKDAREMLNLATQSMGLSNRAYTRILARSPHIQACLVKNMENARQE